jgi:hypothetical protein
MNAARTADQIFDETVAIRAQMRALLQKNGRLPRTGTRKGAEWLVLENKLDQAKHDWLVADRAERAAA